MKNKVLVALALVLTLSLSGCSSLSLFGKRLKADVTRKNAEVTCWSGGELILKGISQGKILSEKDSDGYNFTIKAGSYWVGETSVSITPNSLVEVSGDCIIITK